MRWMNECLHIISRSSALVCFEYKCKVPHLETRSEMFHEQNHLMIENTSVLRYQTTRNLQKKEDIHIPFSYPSVCSPVTSDPKHTHTLSMLLTLSHIIHIFCAECIIVMYFFFLYTWRLWLDLRGNSSRSTWRLPCRRSTNHVTCRNVAWWPLTWWHYIDRHIITTQRPFHGVILIIRLDFNGNKTWCLTYRNGNGMDGPIWTWNTSVNLLTAVHYCISWKHHIYQRMLYIECVKMSLPGTLDAKAPWAPAPPADIASSY